MPFTDKEAMDKLFAPQRDRLAKELAKSAADYTARKSAEMREDMVNNPGPCPGISRSYHFSMPAPVGVALDVLVEVETREKAWAHAYPNPVCLVENKLGERHWHLAEPIQPLPRGIKIVAWRLYQPDVQAPTLQFIDDDSEALRKENAELRAALRPVAAIAARWAINDMQNAKDGLMWHLALKVEDLRRIHALGLVSKDAKRD